MPSPEKPRRVFPFVVLGLLALLVTFIARNGVRSLHRAPGWFVDAIRLRLSLDQDASAGAYYDRTGSGPLPLAMVIREMRETWPMESMAVVHHAALEVGTALLHRSDIEAGELVGGKFVPSSQPPWRTNAEMTAEVTASAVLFEDDRRYVFRRK